MLRPGRQQPLEMRSQLEQMLRVQRHRGPDDEGLWFSADQQTGMCHSRLSILDLSTAGHQPMVSADAQLTIVFNGEIYNHSALRQDLMAQGARFRGHSDTEVLLEAWRHWGVEMLAHLRGMFAFALHDTRTGTLFCARDRVGKKPFVYASTDDFFAFASEIPALRAVPGIDLRLDQDALAAMLLHNLRHLPDPHTVWRGVQRLRAGHAMLVKDGRIEKTWRYWTPHAAAGPTTPARLRALLEETVQLRMQADVPVGALLSGGVDSSAIVALMTRLGQTPVRSYALGFDADDEDLRRARHMASLLGCQHQEFYFDAAHQWSTFEQLLRIHGEPIMLLPLIHAAQLCEHIRDDGIKVVLGGHGADELFYGYTGHVRTARLSALLDLAGPLARTLIPTAWRSRNDLLAMLTEPAGTRKALFYRRREQHDWSGVLSLRARASLNNIAATELADWGRACPTGRFIDESNFCALMVENTHSLATSCDLPAMLASVEMRAPFLDQDMIAFALATPPGQKVPWRAPLHRLKWILRQAVADLIPHELLYAPKRGFGSGIAQDAVLRGPWRTHGDRLFAEPHEAGGLFDAGALKAAWQDYTRHGSAGSNVVPKLFAIQQWLQHEGIPA
jgi:asparagine synthase (glutamine-hydrolysing)